MPYKDPENRKEANRKWKTENPEKIRKAACKRKAKNREKILRKHKEYNDAHKKEAKQYREQNEEKIREKHHEYYLKNREKYLAKSKEQRLKDPEGRRQYQQEYSEKHGERKRLYSMRKRRERSIKVFQYAGGKCIKCGLVDDPVVFDFHHLDPATKEFNISRATCGNYSWDRLVKEISKCILVCANCHRKIGNAEAIKRIPVVPPNGTL